MKKSSVFKLFIYLLCFSFFFFTGGFHQVIAQAKEKNLPIGEMVSKGVVKFEAKENVWKNAETSHFPIFEGMKIKTEKGMATISLTNIGQVGIAPNSLLSFERIQNIQIYQGSMDFRIHPEGEMKIKIGKLTVIKTPSLQASKNHPVTPPKSEETIGTVTVLPNGSVNIKASQGKLSILDEDHTVIAGLSPKDSITLPSKTVKGTPKVMVAQAGETPATGATTEGFLGLPTWAWVGIGVAAVAVGAGIGIAAAQDDDDDRIPLCP